MGIRHNFVSARPESTDPNEVSKNEWNQDHVVSSTALITDLNADLWDGYQFADYFNQAVKTTSSPTFANLIITAGGDIKPSADSTTALNIAQADGTNLVTFDMTNRRVKVGSVNQGAMLQAGETKTSGTYGGLFGQITKANTASDGTTVYGVNGWAIHSGSADLTNPNPAGLIGGKYQVTAQSASAVVVSNMIGLYTQVQETNASTVTNGYSLRTDGHTGTITNSYHLYLVAHATGKTNAYSIWLEKQINGSAINSGIILDGDGVGADLVLGDGQDAKIYYDGVDLILDPDVVGTGGVRIGGKLINDSTMRLKGYTVATLPAGTQGDTAYITDGNVIPAKGVAPVGGGAAVGVCFYDGAAWVGI